MTFTRDIELPREHRLASASARRKILFTAPGRKKRSSHQCNLKEKAKVKQRLHALPQQAISAPSTEGSSRSPRDEERKRKLESFDAPSFQNVCQDRGVRRLKRDPAAILQLNIGLHCNQACHHCHVESSPQRTEMMDRATAERCIELLTDTSSSISTVDLTGGAPELNSQFRFLVSHARALGLEVIDRCNLTVLLEPGQEDLVPFLTENQVRVVASLPCYSSENVNQQRGGGVFDRSILGLQMLNAAGYGQSNSPLMLDLVYNPNGAFLAPDQADLQEAYKRELDLAFGIKFNRLFCLNNMPIKRYADYLSRTDQIDSYMQLLLENFNPGAANGVMCRDTINVGWDGRIFDCDFNQQLGLGMRLPEPLGGSVPTVHTIDSLEQLTGRKITSGTHCFGCTAGSGSSCQGSTV